MKYLNAYNDGGEDEDEEPLCFQIYTGYRGFEGCVRAHFLDELLQLLPENTIEFGKNIEEVVDQGDDKKVLLKFSDRSTAEADAGMPSRYSTCYILSHSRACTDE